MVIGNTTCQEDLTGIIHLRWKIGIQDKNIITIEAHHQLQMIMLQVEEHITLQI